MHVSAWKLPMESFSLVISGEYCTIVPVFKELTVDLICNLPGSLLICLNGPNLPKSSHVMIPNAYLFTLHLCMGIAQFCTDFLFSSAWGMRILHNKLSMKINAHNTVSQMK